VSEDDGVLLEARSVPGSNFLEYRVTMVTGGDVEELCARALGSGAMHADEPHLVARTVLSQQPDELVTWDEVAPPVVSPRDYVVRRTRTRLPGGACQVEFHADPTVGPPPKPGWVRIEVLKGSFTFTPLGGGRVRIEHLVHTEPGGMIAPFAAEPTRREAAVASVRRLAKPKAN
jgi:hypothetical protein